MKKKTTRRICLTALMAAIIYVFTGVYPLAEPHGLHACGRRLLYLAASLLPAPYAAAAGAIGAGLADLLSGYSIWAPGTIIIKALTAFCFTNKLDKLVNKRNILGIVPRLSSVSADIISMKRSLPELRRAPRSESRDI